MCQDHHLEDNKQITRGFFDALSRADSAAVARLYADDFTLWTAGTLPFSGTFTKTQALQGMGQILGLFPDGLRFTINAMTAEDERVAVEAESHGRHASGKTYHNHYHFLLIIRGGKIVALKEYMDSISQTIRSRGHWEVVIRPLRFLPRRIENIMSVFRMVQDRSVQLSGWDFPHVDAANAPRIGEDWVEQEIAWLVHAERWRMYQSGQFAFIGTYQGEWEDPGYPRAHLPPHHPVLAIEDVVRTAHEVFQFAQRLAMSSAGDSRMLVRLVAHAINDRSLHTFSPLRHLRGPRTAQISDFPQEDVFDRDELMADSARHADRWATELFRRFGWDPAPGILEGILGDVSIR